MSIKSNKVLIFSSKVTSLILLCIIVSSCYGPRLNKKYDESNSNSKTLVEVSDDYLTVGLENLIVRNARDSWVKDAKWDEYIFSIEKNNDEEILIQKITVTDSLGHEVYPENTRRALNKATRKMKKKFNKAGIKVELGKGSTKMLSGSLTGIAVGAGLGAGIASGGSVAFSAGTLTTSRWCCSSCSTSCCNWWNYKSC